MKKLFNAFMERAIHDDEMEKAQELAKGFPVDIALPQAMGFLAGYNAALAELEKSGEDWINSKDQLPEEGIDVLCFSRADDRLFVGTFMHYANKEKTWCDDECFGLTVDFWQPLPEQPHAL